MTSPAAALPAPVLPVLTPEGVRLELELAGVGSRGLAALVDLLLAAVLLAAVGAAGVPVLAAPRDEFAGTGVGAADAAARLLLRGLVPGVLAAVVVPLVLELALGGRTPGKRVLGLRVVAATGERADPVALLTRNLLRPLDLLPGSYAVGALAVLATPRAQRLGDLAAGTAVVRARAPLPAYGSIAVPRPTYSGMGPPTPDGQSSDVARVDTRGWDVSRLTAQQREVLQAFAARRYALPPAVRASFTGWLAEVLHRVVTGPEPDLPDDVFLDALLLRLTARRPGGR